MSEKCLDTQRLISLAYDGEVVTSADLQAAKKHCSECASCAAYVNGLARLRAVPTPAAPASVIDAAISAVRVERMRDAEKAAISTARQQNTDVDADAGAVPLRQRDRLTRITTWGAAAAAVFLVVGVITWQGVRYLAAPMQQTASTDTFSYEDLEKSAAPQANSDAGVVAGSAQPGATDEMYATVQAAPPYVVFDGWVYQVSEDEERIGVGAESIGTLTTDFGTGTPSRHDVYAGNEPLRILVAEDGRDARVAEQVTRQFDGKTYGLTSSDITVFGTWPALTASHPQPSSAEGMPEYDRQRTDSEGTAIFVQPGADPGAGFAIAPGTPETDPAAANPNWTWWAPL